MSASASLLACLSFAAFATTSLARADGSEATRAPDDQHALSRADLAAFFAGLIPHAMARDGAVGAVVVVTRGDQVAYAQGFGFANAALGAEASAESTVIRVGSISKLFTWTAVMQLVEEGLLELEADVNRYLDFSLPQTFENPVTLRQLMTHTAGFEETIRGTFFKTPDQLAPLDEYLKAHIPRRIYAPGSTVAYSNYGATLAGYIVERASGMPFERYVEQHILQPLAMERSSFAQPLQPALSNSLAATYRSSIHHAPEPFEYIAPTPAGALSATALDMARFMIAQLGGGEPAILSPASLAQMHEVQWRAAPDAHGFALGFYELSRSGQRIIAHAGDTSAFHSELLLFPAEEVGLFFSFIGGAPSRAVRNALWQAFQDRYFANQDSSADAKQESETSDPRRFAGWYLSTRRIESGLQLLQAFSQARVAALPDGNITVSVLSELNGEPKVWRQVAPLRFQDVHSSAELHFLSDERGRVRGWISDVTPPAYLFERREGLHSQGAFMSFTAMTLLVLVVTALSTPLAWLNRRRYVVGWTPPVAQRWTRGPARLAALVQVLALLGWIGFVASIARDPVGVMSRQADGTLTALYCISALGVVGALFILGNAFAAWRAPRSLPTRLGESLAGLAALHFTWLALTYGLASFSYRY